MIPGLVQLIAANNTRWANHKTKSSWANTAHSAAERLTDPDARAIYQRIAARTFVPWFVIAVIHEREAGQHWGANIAQGDPWNRVSVNVPTGRGPFRNFEEAAYDALVNCAPYASKWTDWTPGGALTLLEQYNGLSYSRGPIDYKTQVKQPPQASPYIWSGTDQYVKGKFIRDHVFDKDAVDQQLGCALLFDAMNVYPKSIAPAASGASPPESPPPKLPAAPSKADTPVHDTAVAAAGAAAVATGVTAWWQHGLYVVGITVLVLAIVGLAVYLYRRGK